MNKKLFGVALLGALLSVGTFVSCKDYDDDIDGLKTELADLKSKFGGLQSDIEKGAVITDVSKSANGIVVTLSNGKTYEITNGKDGKDGVNGQDGTPGSVVKIGENGHWFIDDVDTGLAAQGPAGKDGKDGKDGVDGKDGQNGSLLDGAYWEPRPDGYFWKVEADGTETKSDIMWLPSAGGENGITALVSTETISFYGVTGSNGPVTISLHGFLSSMVFMPSLYLDGIEATKYTFVEALEQQTKTIVDDKARVNANGSPRKAYHFNNKYVNDTDISNTASSTREHEYVPKDKTKKTSYWHFAPAQALQYHVNPANADIQATDIYNNGFNVLNPEILQTRAVPGTDLSRVYNVKAVAEGGWSGKPTDLLYADYKWPYDLQNVNLKHYHPATGDPATVAFGNVNGILNVGLTMEPWALPDAHQSGSRAAMVQVPTTEDLCTVNKDGYVAALQMKSQDTENPVVTSDYALLLPVKRTITALAWYKKPMYLGIAQTAAGAPSRRGDVVDPNCHGADQVHLYTSPEDALKDPAGAALEIDWRAGMDVDHPAFDLTQYLGICYTEEIYNEVLGCSTGTHDVTKTGILKYGEETPYGLYYEFERVNYTLDENVTCESDFIRELGEDAANKGHYEVANVIATGERKNSPMVTDAAGKLVKSETSVDREPLIRVLVKNNYNEVVLEGYVLFHIYRQLPNLEVPDYPIWKKEFPVCTGLKFGSTTWSQFDNYVLTNRLDNMTKERFDDLYVPDMDANNDMYIYLDAPAEGESTRAPIAPGTGYGTIHHNTDPDGTTNHTFSWSMTAAELEAWTHDTTLPVNVPVYIRYRAKKTNSDSQSKYQYVYIKLEVELTRKAATIKSWVEKNTNYWYGMANKDDNGLEAVHFDVEAPRDNYYVVATNSSGTPLTHPIDKTYVGNAVSQTVKYYFLPNATATVVDENKHLNCGGGSHTNCAFDTYTYEFTAWDGTVTDDYNKLYCYYRPSDVHPYNYATLTTLLDACAIDFNRGAFTNNTLYVRVTKNGGTLVGHYPVATIDQINGILKIDNSNVWGKRALNAIGYHGYRGTDSDKVFGAWIGVIGDRCDDNKIAKAVKDDIFMVNWQRPINMNTTDTIAIDARTNENFIYLYDVLDFYDWRNVSMMGDNLWHWIYYGIKEIDIDMDHITTNMHQNPTTFVPFKSVTTKAELWSSTSINKQSTKNGVETYSFWNNSISGTTLQFKDCNKVAANPDLWRHMESHKDEYGALYYENNGDNVTEFTIKVPITVRYTWGELKDVITITIVRTTGN